MSAWMQRGFHAFLRPYLRRHFHCIGVLRDSFDPQSLPAGRPLIVYGNHPSWWDPLIAHFLNAELFAPRQFYAPIDAAALRQYQVLTKLGFFGIDLNSTAGAAAFLAAAGAVLRDGNTALWMTPEGRFCDVRDHSAPLMPGQAHLCSKQTEGAAIPLALEYVFWEERLPLCLAHLGPPLELNRPCSKPQWNEALTDALRTTQKRLAEAVIARDDHAIRPLMTGRVGAGAVYDTARRFKAWLTRSTFRSSHGEKFR